MRSGYMLCYAVFSILFIGIPPVLQSVVRLKISFECGSYCQTFFNITPALKWLKRFSPQVKNSQFKNHMHVNGVYQWYFWPSVYFLKTLNVSLYKRNYYYSFPEWVKFSFELTHRIEIFQ